MAYNPLWTLNARRDSQNNFNYLKDSLILRFDTGSINSSKCKAQNIADTNTIVKIAPI